MEDRINYPLTIIRDVGHYGSKKTNLRPGDVFLGVYEHVNPFFARLINIRPSETEGGICKLDIQHRETDSTWSNEIVTERLYNIRVPHIYTNEELLTVLEKTFADDEIKVMFKLGGIKIEEVDDSRAC